LDVSLVKLSALLNRFGRPLFTGDSEVFRRLAAAAKTSLD